MTAGETNADDFDPASAQAGIAFVHAIARRNHPLHLSGTAWQRIDAAHRSLVRAIGNGASVYGVTTGLGAGVDTAIAVDEARQQRIAPARAVGIGERARRDEVRAIIAARIFGFCAGHSGVSVDVVQVLVDMLNAGLHPVVPMTGSIGESDLAPLAHIALAFTGEGEVELGGKTMKADEAFAQAGLDRPVLRGKDGLALVSANAASAGTGALLVRDARQALRAGIGAVALSFEGYRANVSPLDPRAGAIRPAPGQVESAAALLALLAGGDLAEPGAARRLQDPLSFRCIASVNGAAFGALDVARAAVELELRSSDDNPAILPETDTVLANANFDTTHLALSIESLGMALTRIAACSVERVMKLMSPASSDLPRFLARSGEGRNGYATLQKTAAALLAEICHAMTPMPVVVAPVADRVEDYATMALSSVRKTAAIVEKLRLLTAIEMMVAAQAIDMGKSIRLGAGTTRLHEAVRGCVAPLGDDRPSTPDIESLDRLIAADGIETVLAPFIGTDGQYPEPTSSM